MHYVGIVAYHFLLACACAQTACAHAGLIQPPIWHWWNNQIRCLSRASTRHHHHPATSPQGVCLCLWGHELCTGTETRSLPFQQCLCATGWKNPVSIVVAAAITAAAATTDQWVLPKSCKWDLTGTLFHEQTLVARAAHVYVVCF